jgi:hypothetical protein
LAVVKKGAEGCTVLSNWAFEGVGRVLVLCSIGPNPPPDREFEIYLERLLQADIDRILIYGEGGSPSVTQRKRIAETWKSKGRSPHVALMTDSSVARGLLTAVGWLVSGKMKPFALGDLQGVLGFLEATDASAEISAAVARLRAALAAGGARSA